MLYKKNYTCLEPITVALEQKWTEDGLRSFFLTDCDIEIILDENIGYSLDGQNQTVLYGFRNDKNVIAALYDKQKKQLVVTKVVAKSMQVIETLLLTLSKIGVLDKSCESGICLGTEYVGYICQKP